MTQWKQNILEAIGNTPLVRLQKVVDGTPGELFVKCEFMNPGGSIKDRIGRYMVEVAEKSGELKPGGTIVEATSGNTGVGLAMAAAVKGYKCVFVMPDKMSEEKRAGLRAFGAEVVITPSGVPPESPDSHYKTAARLAAELPNTAYMNQYQNLANRETHYLTTGPEIWQQTDGGQIDAIVAGMGTCGTISGIGKFFKEKKPSVKIIGVDPKGSILKETFETGKHGEAIAWKIEGIGEDMIPANCDFSVLDEIVEVEDTASYLMARRLLAEEGISVGSSCGAAVVGALQWMRKQKNPGRVLVILPDSGSRYLSKLFNDAWMIENGFHAKSEHTTIGTLARVLRKPAGAPSVDTTSSISDAVEKLRSVPGATHLVVTANGSFSGIVEATALLSRLASGRSTGGGDVGSAATRNFRQLREGETVRKLQETVRDGSFALISEGGKAKYVLSKTDVESFLS